MSDNLHVVCPHCTATNRIPRDRLDKRPKCGKCHQYLFTAHPVELDQSTFQKHVRNNDIPLLVDFWAPWCGPCKTMAPAYQQAAAQLEPRVRLAKVNTEAHQRLGMQFGIRSIPTMMLFKNGQAVASQAGAMGAADIVRWTMQYL